MALEHETATAEREFIRVLEGRRLQTVFQPIVDLKSGATVGYEALVRGPRGSPIETAPALLAAAYRADRVVEFDWAARGAACRAAMAHGLNRDQLLFINIEPLALDSECPRDLWSDIERAFDTFQVALEVTERSLDRDPGSLLDGIDRLRPMVAGLALDDVGSNEATMSLLPLVAPAVIKLDLGVTQAGPTPNVIRILDVVLEESERTGAAILCEGVETSAHLDFARSICATLGQGQYFGAPDSLVEHAGRDAQIWRLRADTPPAVAAPFDALAAHTTSRAPVSLLTALSQQLQSYAVEMPGVTLLIIHLPEPHLFGEADRRSLARVAELGGMAAVLGPAIPADPGDGIRGVGLRHDPPLAGQWAVVALSPSSAVGMLARAVPGKPTEFDFGITHDKQRVIAAARCLFRRLGASHVATL